MGKQAEIHFKGTATFFMKSGNSFEILCDTINIDRRGGQVIAYSITGYDPLIGQPMGVNPEQIEAIVWNAIPVIVRAKDGSDEPQKRIVEI